MKHIYSIMNDNKLNKEIIGDDYPTYEQYVTEYNNKKNSATFNENILTIANKLRKGDQITIWADQYQIHFKGVGTSNFPIPREN